MKGFALKRTFVYISQMSRSRLISDASVFQAVRRLLAESGDKAVTFSAVAQATGLAAPTLVQRYSSVAAMIQAALSVFCDQLVAALDMAESTAPDTAKGAQRLLKDLAESCPEVSEVNMFSTILRDPALRHRMTLWRQSLIAALAQRLDARGEAAAILFAAWQGQMLWHPAGGQRFRLKDVIKAVSE